MDLHLRVEPGQDAAKRALLEGGSAASGEAAAAAILGAGPSTAPSATDDARAADILGQGS